MPRLDAEAYYGTPDDFREFLYKVPSGRGRAAADALYRRLVLLGQVKEPKAFYYDPSINRGALTPVPDEVLAKEFADFRAAAANRRARRQEEGRAKYRRFIQQWRQGYRR